MNARLFVVSLGVLASVPSQAIIRRVDVPDAQYQNLANGIPLAWVQYPNPTATTVSAALISDKFLLSAAHTYSSGLAAVKLGGETYQIVAWVKNPLYDGANILAGHDFSVARLDRRVLNTAPLKVRSIPVPAQTLLKSFGMGATGLGNGTGYQFPYNPVLPSWPARGMTNQADEDMANYPNVILTDFDNPSGTSNALDFLESNATSTAQEGNLIWGDSGGPLTQLVGGEEQIVGVNSALSNQNGNSFVGDYGDLSFFSRVSTDYSWIVSAAWEAGRVQGKVVLNEFVGNPMIRTATIELRSIGSTTALETFTVPLAADGGWSFVTSRRGATSLRILVPGFLATAMNINITNTSPGNLEAAMVNGDTDGSQEVDLADIDNTIAGYGTGTNDPMQGDLNGSGEVELADIDIAIASYGLGGAP